MAILFGSSGEQDDLLSSINTTPLVDVMLVLLIIFLITVPVVTHTVPVSLPRETNQPTQTSPRNVNISVDNAGTIYWNQEKIPDLASLQTRLNTLSAQVPQPEVHVWGDQNAHYQSIGQILFDCQRAGIQKIGFITQPPASGTGD